MQRKHIRYNKKELADRITAALIGKNIGGTVGTPYEGKREMLDIDGFSTPPGEPLPNDDLDLQLVWLYAMEKEGPFRLDSRILGEYWLSMIPPHWNEYGVGKANLREGFTAPLSGELHNEKWKHSNGAWIRSEIWAALAPGYPSVARRYAFADASVDHGLGEGTYAELFTATVESIAYFVHDVRAVLEHGLAAIPEDCRVARAVRLVMEEYDKGTPYREVREMLVEQSRDIGWFQAPANLGYVAVGLLYGEGDFKKSIIYAVNCGDDTDCTGATIGAILGIIGGTAGIPRDWAEHIGERIVTCSIDGAYRGMIPASCGAFTQRILRLIPVVLYANGIDVEYTDGEGGLPDAIDYEPNTREKHAGLYGLSTTMLCKRAPFSFDLPWCGYAEAVAEYDRAPIVSPGDTLTLRVRLYNKSEAAFHIRFETILPEGWTADYRKSVAMAVSPRTSCVEITLTAGEKVEAINHVYVIGRATGRSLPVFADFVIEG